MIYIRKNINFVLFFNLPLIINYKWLSKGTLHKPICYCKLLHPQLRSDMLFFFQKNIEIQCLCCLGKSEYYFCKWRNPWIICKKLGQQQELFRPNTGNILVLLIVLQCAEFSKVQLIKRKWILLQNYIPVTFP